MEERNDSQGLEAAEIPEAGEGAETFSITPELQLIQEPITFTMVEQ